MTGKAQAASSSTPPRSWPSDVTYLSTSCQPSERLSDLHRAIFCKSPLDDESTYSTATLRAQDLTTIGKISNPAHPAYGQCGLFAKQTIPPRTVIVPYLGVVHTEEESDQTSDYDLRVWGPAEVQGSSPVPLGIDATHAGNEARFVNDYRGIAERANVFFEEYEISAPSGRPPTDSRRGLVFKSGSQPIKAGTELVVSYGKGFWQARRQEQASEEQAKQQQPEPITPVSSKAPPANAHIQAMLDRQRARLKGQGISR